MFLCAAVAFAAVTGVDRALALVSSTIAIDGSFSDWLGARSDSDNVVRDTQIPTDPDYPAEADRDVYLVNATYDTDYLYLSWRRTAGGQKAITFGAYIDTSGDGLLQDDEPVVVYTVGTGNPYCSEGWILHYNQARDTATGPKLYPEGDPMGRDGDTPDGWARWQDGYTDPTRALDAYLAPNGIECEARVAWTDLGIPAGSPISIHFADGNGEAWGNPGTPSVTWKPIGGGKLLEEFRGQVEDNVEEIWWLRRSGVSVTPDNVRGASENTTVTYDHTVTNLGNQSETFDLTALSSRGWSMEVLDASGIATSAVTISAGTSLAVRVRVSVPAGTGDGVRDVTRLTASARSNPGVVSSATDTTTVGRVSVTPVQSGSIAPGQTINYAFTVSNNTSVSGTFDLSALSNRGFRVTLADEVGSSISSVVLGPGGSAVVVAGVSVPVGTALGTQDVTRLFATLRTDPGITANSTATTAVRDGLEIVADSSASGGAGAAVAYTHTITNSWPTTRTVGVSAVSSRGWPVSVFAADGTTPLTSITLGPNGASGQVIVRVAVPGTASNGVVDVTTVTASVGGATDSVRDTTTVRRLALYSTPGYLQELYEYLRGDTAFARATGLSAGSEVYFVWKSPSATTVRTSPDLTVDTMGMAFDECALPDDAPTGTWTCELRNARTDALLETLPFKVGYHAKIVELSATDAATIGAATSVTSTLSNRGGVAITNSTANYRIWWDTDGDKVFDSGDIYVDAGGNPVTYTGGIASWTHTTPGVDVAAKGTWTDPGWTMSSANFPNQGTYNVTEVWLAWDGTTEIDEALAQFFSVPTIGEWFNGLGVMSLPAIALFGFAWTAAVLYLRRRRAWLSYYVLGSIGFVVFVLFVAQALGLDTRLEAIEAVQVGWLAKVSHVKASLLPPSGLAIGNHVGWGVFDIGIECSALLEMAVFAALVGFYPPWRPGKKALIIVLGVAATYVVNLLRILIIVGMIAQLGTDWVFIAHAVVGRVFFFVGVVAIFWFLVTMPTVRTLSARLEASNG